MTTRTTIRNAALATLLVAFTGGMALAQDAGSQSTTTSSTTTTTAPADQTMPAPQVSPPQAAAPAAMPPTRVEQKADLKQLLDVLSA